MIGLPSQVDILTTAIEFSSQSHRAISQNVANVNTPGYKAQALSFGQLLGQLDQNSGKDQVPQFDLELVQGLATRSDGNNVDLDRELANLKKNALVHQTLTQLLGTQMSIMQRAISG